MAGRNKEVLRRCVSCGKMRDKKDMIRIVRTADGEILNDSSGKMNGRGAYICRDTECVKKALSGRALARSLKCGINSSMLDALSEDISDTGRGSCGT